MTQGLRDMLAETLCRAHSKDLPEKIRLKKLSGVASEGYEVGLEPKTIRATATTELGLAYGASQLAIASRSGHTAEWQGKREPRCAYRMIWPGCKRVWRVSDSLALPLPGDFGHSSSPEEGRGAAAAFAKGLVELGYNTVVLSCKDHESVEEVTDLAEPLSLWVEELQKLGLKIVIQPEITGDVPGACPLLKEVKLFLKDVFHQLLQAVPSINGVLWSSAIEAGSYGGVTEARDFLMEDLLIEELNLVERLLPHPKELFFHLPFLKDVRGELQVQWLQKLMEEAGPFTRLVFPFVAGAPWNSFLDEHPFWESLRRVEKHSCTPLIPILNVGNVCHGEGLWPNTDFSAMDRLAAGIEGTPVSGAIALCEELPPLHGMLGCALWVFSQLLWNHVRACQLATTWCQGVRPEWKAAQLEAICKEATEVTQELGRLSVWATKGVAKEADSQPIRIRVESLVARLNAMAFVYGQVEESSSITLGDYVTFFVRDSKRHIHHLLQKMGVSMASVIQGDDLKEAFWTAMDSEPGRGIVGGAQVTFHREPNSGKEGSRLQQVLKENR